VSGRVQGVWFRQSCRREAQRLGLSGWVRNRADGDVEFEAEGAAPAVDRLVRWAHDGPPRALVTSVAVEPVTPAGPAASRTGFVVR
jgi:acylphosphatase